MILDSNSASGGYDIDNSVKTEAANNEYFYRSSPTQGNRQTFTFSFWHKRTQITGYPADPYYIGQGSNGRFHLTGNTHPTIRFMFDGNSTELESSPRLRDTAAWYHIVLAVDTTQATASNRVKLYLNGEQISWDNSKYPSQNATSDWMSTTNMYFNTSANGLNAYDNSGYWAEVCVIDGQQLAPTSFGEFDSDSGIWKPKDVSGLTFGNEGFYLDFEDSSDLGADVSGNNNDCTLNNIAAADQATDTPTNNFCTLNILDQEFDGTNIVTDGATNVRIAGSGTGCIRATQAVSSGKWYWEFKLTPINTSTFYGVWGIYTAETSPPEGYPGATGQTGSWGVYGGNGEAAGSSGFNTFYTDGFSSGDIIGLAYDVDGGTLKMYKNGTLVGANSGDIIASSGVSHPAGFTSFLPAFADGTNSPEPSGLLSRFEVNFGGFTNFSISSGNSDANGYGNFEYAPPSGYYAICSKNLAEYG
tara:strand:- start:2570 stop:3988 length:1419 start_codon:yes stop_codon:yes gene_type:complete